MKKRYVKWLYRKVLKPLIMDYLKQEDRDYLNACFDVIDKIINDL